mmetsp:Transcript_33596/g.86032  ORF Transcript_33596/g.86032 Transcript_33596/m.86032 type:complete len:101 (-) Transcript_33596:1636-1938(-)
MASSPKPDPNSLDSLLIKKRKAEDDLRNVERQIYELEGRYLEDTSTYGNILTGWSSFLASTSPGIRKEKKDITPEERLFSLSSLTAPKVRVEENRGRRVE